MAAGGEARLRGALVALRDALDAAGAPWMCIGGIAVMIAINLALAWLAHRMIATGYRLKP